MYKLIFQLFRRKPWYLNFIFGMFISGIGSGLTQTAVYWQLGIMHAPALGFGVAFAASLLPGLVSSHIGAVLTKSIGPFRVLLLAECGGAISLAIPWLGVHFGSTGLFAVSTFLPGFFGGLCVGAASEIMKTNFGDKEYPALAALDAILFTGTVIFANGLGAVIVTFVSIQTFLRFDALTYVVGGIALLVAMRYATPVGTAPSNSPEMETSDWRFSIRQRRAFYAMPLLAVVTTPAMALLPAFGAHSGIVSIGGISVGNTVAFLFARSLGQLIGPFVIRIGAIEGIFGSAPKMLSLVISFVGLYAAAFSAINVWISLALVVAAHISTNVLFVAIESSLFSAFPQSGFAGLMVRRYQIQVLLMAVMSIVATSATAYLSVIQSYLIFTLPALVIFSTLLWRAMGDDDVLIKEST
jgi:DHA3 family macrolide efflux protein-like MFS transporter